MGGERGFTILESLISFCLTALAIATFLGVMLLSVRLDERSRRISDALLCVQERMESLSALGWAATVADCLPAPAGAGSGGEARHVKEFRRRGRQYRLECVRREIRPRLNRYTVACWWEDRRGRFGRANSVRLTTARRSR